jgi:hypothetical protein
LQVCRRVGSFHAQDAATRHFSTGRCLVLRSPNVRGKVESNSPQQLLLSRNQLLVDKVKMLLQRLGQVSCPTGGGSKTSAKMSGPGCKMRLIHAQYSDKTNEHLSQHQREKYTRKRENLAIRPDIDPQHPSSPLSTHRRSTAHSTISVMAVSRNPPLDPWSEMLLMALAGPAVRWWRNKLVCVARHWRPARRPLLPSQ